MYGSYEVISGRKTTDVGRVLTDATKFHSLTYDHHSTVFATRSSNVVDAKSRLRTDIAVMSSRQLDAVVESSRRSIDRTKERVRRSVGTGLDHPRDLLLPIDQSRSSCTVIRSITVTSQPSSRQN